MNAVHRHGIRLGLVGVIAVVAACTPPPAAPSTVVDFGDQASTVGSGGCTNCTTVTRTVPDGRGNEVSVSLETFDPGSGYTWDARDTFTAFPGGTPSFCSYPLLQVRARATLDGATYRMDWDGDAADGVGPYLDLGAPWRVAAGQYATIHVESMTLDLTAPPRCVPI